MMINKAVLHIFDFNTNVCVVSQKDLDFSSDVVYEYVSKRLNRIIGDAAQKTGVFYATSAFQMKLQALVDGTMTFDDLASQTARELYQLLAHCDEPESTDLLVIDFQDDDDVRNVGILMLENKTAYTHQILDDEGTVYNKLIKHYAILPGLSDFSIHFVDKKRKMDGEDVYLLPDKLLQCTSVISSKEAVKVVSKIAEKVAEEHGASTVEALSKAKTYLVENAETADSFSPQDLGSDVFGDSPVLQREFEEQIKEAKLPEAVAIEKEYAQKAGRSHKIKTDTGIEITFPSEYIENTDFIQFINNPDGTLSIELKNIGKIVNK